MPTMAPKTPPLRVMLVDDHEIVRDGIRAMLESQDDIVVTSEAGSVRDAIDEAARTRPDVIVMDVRLTDGSGIEATREIRAARPATKVLMLTSFADDEALFASIMAGASGYILKEVNAQDLLGAVRHVAAGHSLIDPLLVERVLDRVRNGPETAPELANLTEQELRLLELIAEGLTNRQIGERMFLAEKTVKNYVSTLLGKMGLERRTQAAVLASRLLSDRPHH
jgi:DNA-binding NarL/FixJ family response regulator